MRVSASTSGGSLYSVAGARKYLTSSERTRFIEQAMHCSRAELASLCITIAYTGCRISEALALTKSSIDPIEGVIAIRCKKKRGRIVVREVPVPKDVATLIINTHAAGALGRGQRLWTWSRCRAWQLIKLVMTQAGIGAGIHATPKGLRHGFGLHAIRSGVPLNLVQRWLGHANMTTTAIYLQAIGSEEREIAQRMWSSPVNQS
ncbi:MAG: site-specific integrase [Hyphomicrobium sp.]|jgi:integrase|uniref:tyrosine-type recombinase/integrase n=1 Tax=Hyphomicrobium sp. TaxID=82 RepID=UPI0025BAE6A2|nr:site-specific integrase [Hyphomicrobium sp.]MBX9865087.1 site-specific integrase [Hyphomicrobium sp.]